MVAHIHNQNLYFSVFNWLHFWVIRILIHGCLYIGYTKVSKKLLKKYNDHYSTMMSNFKGTETYLDSV